MCLCLQALRPTGSQIWATSTPEAHNTPTVLEGYVYVVSQSLDTLIAFYQINGTLAWKTTVPAQYLSPITGAPSCLSSQHH
jgi:outer membrane protein assembly factor BamB